MVLDTDYYILNDIYIWKTGDWAGKKVYKLVSGKYIPATATTIRGYGTFSASKHSIGTISFNPGDTLNPWNLNTIEFQENPVNIIAPILMSFTIKNTGDTLMGISICEISDTMRSNVSSNGYDSDNFTAQYNVDGVGYKNFTSNNTDIIKCLAKNEFTTIVVKYAVLQDTVSIENLSTSFTFNFGKSVGISISDPLVSNSNPRMWESEAYNTTLSNENGLILPNTIEIITNDDEILTAGTDYTYTLCENSTSATLSIPENKIFNNLHITCNTILMVTPTISNTSFSYNDINRENGTDFEIPKTTDLVVTLTTTIEQFSGLDANHVHDIVVTIGGKIYKELIVTPSIFEDNILRTTFTIPSTALIGAIAIKVNCCDTWDGSTTDLTNVGWNYVDLTTDFELNKNVYLNNERFVDQKNDYLQITDGINTIYVGNGITNAGIYYTDTLGTLAVEHIEDTTEGHYYYNEGRTTLYYRDSLEPTASFSTLNIWTPVATNYGSQKFTGTFDGNNYIVSGLYINKTAPYSGLFGCSIGSGGLITNIGVINSYINSSSKAGSVCGRDNEGTIANCYNTGSVGGEYCIGGICSNNFATISDCYNTGSVSGTQSSVGGICGYNYRTIINCYNTGNVSANYSIPNSSVVGGVCGENYSSGATISNCYNTGNVSGTTTMVGGVCGENNSGATIINCYNTGNVSGRGNVGGVSGYSYYGTIINCYNVGSVSGEFYYGGVAYTAKIIINSYHNLVIGGVGTKLTEKEMKKQISFIDWDFDNIWEMVDNSYPTLRVFNP